MLKCKNDSKRLVIELNHRIDPRLEGVIRDLAAVTGRVFSKDLTITCLFRSEAENDAVGGYEFSAHLVGRGGDLRSRNFSDEEKKSIDTYLHKVYGKDYLYWKFHNSGHGEHLHLNIRFTHGRWDDELKECFENQKSRNTVFLQ